MIAPQARVYEGMIVGEHTRDNDLVVNITQGKKLSNVRAAGKDENLILTPPMRLTLEKAMSYIADDELVEVTPSSIRLRKRWLDPNERKKQERGERPSARRAWRDASANGRCLPPPLSGGEDGRPQTLAVVAPRHLLPPSGIPPHNREEGQGRKQMCATFPAWPPM